METTNKTTWATIYQSSTRINTGSWSSLVRLRSLPNSPATSTSAAMTQRRRIARLHPSLLHQMVRINLTTKCTEEWGNHRISASTKKVSKRYKSSLKTLNARSTRLRESIARAMLRNKTPTGNFRTANTPLLRWLGKKLRQPYKKFQAQQICHLTNHDTWAAMARRTTKQPRSLKNSKTQLLKSRQQLKN